MFTLLLESGTARIQPKARERNFGEGEWVLQEEPGSGGGGGVSDLDIVLQTPDQLAVHLPRLSHPDAAALGLAEAVLQDAAGFVGLLQLQPQLLQLVHLLLLEHVTHLQHLTAKLLHLILVKTAQTSGVNGKLQIHK